MLECQLWSGERSSEEGTAPARSNPGRECWPEENLNKAYYLRPPRLRRSTATRNSVTFGQHSLPGVELYGREDCAFPVRISLGGHTKKTDGSVPSVFSTQYATLRFLGAILQFVQKLPTLHPNSAAYPSTATKYAAIHNFFGYP